MAAATSAVSQIFTPFILPSRHYSSIPHLRNPSRRPVKLLSVATQNVRKTGNKNGSFWEILQPHREVLGPNHRDSEKMHLQRRVSVKSAGTESGPTSLNLQSTVFEISLGS